MCINDKSKTYSLKFKDIVYDVVNKNISSSSKKYLRLIHGISGEFESGKLTAIMGPSGSCKISFLNLLAGRIEPDSKTSGEITYRGEKRKASTWPVLFSYLEQDDIIMSNQTAGEFIEFAVGCRNKDLKKQKDVDHVVDTIMADLSISHLKNVKLDVVSGGERKRVMIAVEFAIGSEIIILDEPTSGLDSTLSIKLIKLLKDLAHKHNRIVIMTIHQPGNGLFELIDNLYFIYKGLVMYKGPVSKVQDFFDINNFEIKHGLSKPEFLFELFSESSSYKYITELKPRIENLVTLATNEVKKRTENIKLVTGNDVEFSDISININQLIRLFKRTIRLYIRNNFKMFLFKQVLICVSIFLFHVSLTEVKIEKFSNYCTRVETSTIKIISKYGISDENAYHDIINTVLPKAEEHNVKAFDNAFFIMKLRIMYCFFINCDLLNYRNILMRELLKKTYSSSVIIFVYYLICIAHETLCSIFFFCIFPIVRNYFCRGFILIIVTLTILPMLVQLTMLPLRFIGSTSHLITLLSCLHIIHGYLLISKNNLYEFMTSKLNTSSIIKCILKICFRIYLFSLSFIFIGFYLTRIFALNKNIAIIKYFNYYKNKLGCLKPVLLKYNINVIDPLERDNAYNDIETKIFESLDTIYNAVNKDQENITGNKHFDGTRVVERLSMQTCFELSGAVISSILCVIASVLLARWKLKTSLRVSSFN